MVLPPLPEGFTELPPLPEGFTSVEPDKLPPLPVGFTEVKPKEEAGLLSSESYKVPFANALSTIDTGWSSLAATIPSLLGNTEEADAIYNKQKEREKTLMEWANPEKKSLSIPGEIAGTFASLPVQIPAMAFSPIKTGQTLIDKGEEFWTAMQGAGVDLAGQAAGLVAPGMGKIARVIYGAGANAAQEAAVGYTITKIAKTKEAKEEFEPTVRKAVVAAVVGGGAHGLMGERKPQKTDPTLKQRLNEAEKIRIAAEAEKIHLATKIEEVKQLELELSNTVQQVAEMQARGSAQRDLFAPINQEIGAAPITQTEPSNTFKQQDELPLSNTPEDVAAVRNAQDPSMQRDMFVDQARETTPAALQLKATQERLQRLLEKQTELSKETDAVTIKEDIDKAFLKREIEKKETQSLSEGVARLQNKFSVPKGQRGALILSKDENLFFESIFKNKYDLLDLKEQVPSIHYENKTLHVNPEDLFKLEDYVSETWGASKRQYGGEGSKTLPRTFANAGHKFITKLRVPRNQRGAVDMRIFEDDYFKIKNRPDGKIMTFENNEGIIAARLFEEDGYELSRVQFTSTDIMPSPNSDLFASWVSTNPEVRGKGYAKDLYAWTSELGNDIVASHNQLRDGEAMWDSFERTGFAKYDPVNQKRFIPRSQRGGIDIKAIEDGFKKLRSPVVIKDPKDINNIKQVDSTAIPADPDGTAVVRLGMETPTYTKANKSFSAGATIEAQKTGSPVIKAVSQIVQNWGKRSEKWIREVVYPIEEQFRKFSGKDFVNVHAVFMSEFKLKSRYTPEELVGMGLSKKEVDTHQAMRKAFDETLKIQNEARRLQSKKEISSEEAYYAARWEGSFGANISDAKGDIVWKLTSDTRLGLNREIKQLLKKFPKLKYQDTTITRRDKKIVVPKDFDRLNTRGIDKSDLDSAYTMMVDILGRDNETVQAIKQYREESDTSSSRAVLGQEKHFIEKRGIRGFEGDKADFMSPEKNAKAFFKAQIQYMKNASRWTEIQKASDNLRIILTDDGLTAKDPDNIKYAKDYVANAMGFGEIQAIRNFENYLGKVTGVSPNLVNSMVGTTKGLWVTSKLMFSLGYSLANAYQIANITPHLADLANKGYGGNPIITAMYGSLGGSFLGGAHIITKGQFSDYVESVGKAFPKVMKEAMIYAENNSVTNRSVYDEAQIGTHNSLPWRIAKSTVTSPETLARSIAYMSIVGQLESSGRFPKERWGEMFQLAEERTNMAMGDPRQSERAPVFSKIGIVGNAFNTLQTYPMNWFNQINLFTREAGRGNPIPLFSMFLTQATMAGAIGMAGVEDIHNAWEFVKRHFIPTDTWLKVKDLNIKTALIDMLGETGAYGLPSVMSGSNMTSRLNAPTIQNTTTIPGGMGLDILKTLGDIGDATFHITDESKRAQAILSASPPALKEFIAQTILESHTQTKPDTKGNVGIFSKNKVGDYSRITMIKRTPEEHKRARFGIRTQKEVFLSDVEYPLRTQEQEMRERRQVVGNKIYSQMMTKEKIDSGLVELYVALGGTDLQALLQSKAEKEFTTALIRDAGKAGNSVSATLAYKRVMNLVKKAGYDN